MIRVYEAGSGSAPTAGKKQEIIGQIRTVAKDVRKISTLAEENGWGNETFFIYADDIQFYLYAMIEQLEK